MRSIYAFLVVIAGTTVSLAQHSSSSAVVATTDGRVLFARQVYAQYGCNSYHGVCNTGYVQQGYYRQNYYNPYHVVQKVVAQDYHVQPLYVGVPVQPAYVNVQATGSPYYYSVSAAYNEKAYLRDVLREELRNILGSGNGDAAQPPQAVKQPRAVPKTGPPAGAQPPDGPDTVTPPELQTKVLAAYQETGCLNCHGATGKASGPSGREFRLVADDGTGVLKLARLPSDKRWKVYGMSEVGAMPPSARDDATKAMKQEHLPALLQYAAQNND